MISLGAGVGHIDKTEHYNQSFAGFLGSRNGSIEHSKGLFERMC